MRILVGLALLASAVLALLPALTGYTSLNGTVNARFAVLSAPIEGTILRTAPKAGTALTTGSHLVTIRNERINRSVAASLAAELETVRKRVAAFDLQRQQLGRLRNDLAERLREYQTATLAGLEQELATVRRRIAINEAQQVAANAELQRRQTLGATGVVAGSQVEQARAAQAASEGEGRVARTQLARLQNQLDGVRQGVFVGRDALPDLALHRDRAADDGR